MTKKHVKKIIREIAKREQTDEKEVREEMEKAIMAGYMNVRTRHKWDKLFGKGRIPDVEEFIMVMAGEVKNKKDNVLPE